METLKRMNVYVGKVNISKNMYSINNTIIKSSSSNLLQKN